MGALARGPAVGAGLTAVWLAGGIAGTAIGPLHFGQGNVCPSIGS